MTLGTTALILLAMAGFMAILETAFNILRAAREGRFGRAGGR